MILQRPTSLRRAIACMAICLAAPQLPAQQATIPYRATIAVDGAVIHSGPGTNHYGTDRLPPGATVDVYRNDPGGWMAIRPPEGSFSMLQLDELELMEDGLARVKVDTAVAWVGTRLSAVKQPMWQVRLRRGEIVEVLGIVDRQKFELGQGEPDWVQIMPPAGEFRWIAASDLDLRNTRPLETRQSVAGAPPPSNVGGLASSIVNDDWSTDPEGAAVPADLHLAPPPRDMTRRNGQPGAIRGSVDTNAANEDWSIHVEAANSDGDWPAQPDLDADLSARQSPDRGDGGWRPAQQTISNFVSERSVFDADGSRLQADIVPFSSREPASAPTATSHVRSDIFDANPTIASANFSQVAASLPANSMVTSGDGSLNSLEWRLSQEMLKDPRQWDLLDIARNAQQLYDSTPDSQIRAATGRILEKIRKCREIQAGYEATEGPSPDDLITRRFDGTGPVSRLQATAIAPSASNELLYNYDAFGWLNELISNGGLGESRFVIQDDRGNITHQITAAPGLNLRRYLNQRVGIIGNRGFNQQLNLNQVTAERVVAVDTLRR